MVRIGSDDHLVAPFRRRPPTSFSLPSSLGFSRNIPRSIRLKGLGIMPVFAFDEGFQAAVYLEQHGTPKTPRELTQHACIRVRHGSGALVPWRFGEAAPNVGGSG